MGGADEADSVAAPEAPPTPTPAFGTAETETLFGHLRTAVASYTFAHDDALQYSAVVHLWRAWSVLDLASRERAWRLFDGKLPRVTGAHDPKVCFQQLLALPREEDIRRALLVRGADRAAFAPEAGDGIYPTQGWLGDYLNFAKHNQVPLPFHFWAAVTALGAACRRNVYVESGVTRLYMNQYVVLSGPPATGKSIAMETAIDVLRRVNRKIGDTPDVAPYRLNILPEDITQPGFIDLMSHLNVASWRRDPMTGLTERQVTDATAILPLDELMTFLGKDSFSVGQKVPFLVTIYAKESHGKYTKMHKLEDLENLAVSMLACSAPVWMRQQITQDIFGGGFMDRTHIIYRDRTHRCYPVAPPFDPLQAEALADMLVPLTSMPIKQVAVLDYEAKAWFDEWFRDLFKKSWEAEPDADAKTLNRRANHALKLATLLAVSYGSFPRLSTQHLIEAIQINDAEDQYFQQFMEQVRRAPKADNFDYILRVVVKHGGKMQRGKLLQKIKWKLGTADEAWRYVDTLLRDGTLVMEGQGATTWVMVPNLAAPKA